MKIENSAHEMRGWYPVPEDQLPVLLPDLKDWKPEGTGKGPLAKLPSFVNTKCPECGGKAQRETDVCDTFLDSSWYFLQYPSINVRPSPELPWNPEIMKKWLPVDQYIGGAEHTVLHLLYSRFVTMAMKDFGYLDFEEPYDNFYAHGLIIAEGAKMSKSRGNVIIPDAYIAKYGADTLRTYLMFLGPFDMGGDFRDTGIAGMYRFLNRVWRIVTEWLSVVSSQLSVKENYNKNTLTDNRQPTTDINKVMHRTIKEVTEDLENLRYNTAIAHIMEYVNTLTDNRQLITEDCIKNLLLMLAPFAPHMTEELFDRLLNQESGIKNQGNIRNINKNHDSYFMIHDSIHKHPWPTFDPSYLVQDEVTIVVQVNGKLRDNIKIGKLETGNSSFAKVSADGQKSVEDKAKSSEKVKKFLDGKTIRKVIYVPGKLINFVV